MKAPTKYISGETFEETFKLINDSLAFVGITKTEFAKKMGVSRQNYYFWKHSKRIPWIDFLAALLVLTAEAGRNGKDIAKCASLLKLIKIYEEESK